MSDKVLLVDDEPNVLDGYKRQLRGRVEIDTANGGLEGLDTIEKRGPYAVIISDFKMPGMDGIEFLTKAKQQAPDSIRMMLTGHAQLQLAIDAVNRGHIFRLLVKPFPAENLLQTIQAGIKQYRLVIAERELLEKTLSGSVKVLMEILSLANPAAFSRASKTKRYVRHVASWLELPDVWEFELAALLSQIGCISLPPDLLKKVYTGATLTSDETKMYSEYPEVSGTLLENIPRLENVAGMIKAQQRPFKRRTDGKNLQDEDRVALGGYILKAALEFDRLLARDVSIRTILKRLPLHIGNEVPAIITALENLKIETDRKVVKSIRVPELDRSMIFDEDVYATDGMLLVSKGEEVTFPVIRRLRNYTKGIGVVQPFRVIIQSAAMRAT
ncbi:HD domain-containing phosphohydrolase [Candidatus Neomarinimicrobiota bacterium]